MNDPQEDRPKTAGRLTAEVQSIYRNKPFLRLVLVALLAEIGYAVLNISEMPVYLKYDRHLNEGIITLVLAAYLLSEAAFKTYTGQLADRYGAKLLMVVGPSLSVATSLLTFVVPRTGGTFLEVGMFIGLRALDGLGAAMLWPAAYASISSAVPDKKRQEAMSILNLCYMLGIALALPFGGIVNDALNNTWASMILAAILFACVSLAAGFGLPNFKPDHVEAGQPHEGETGIKEFFQCFKRIPEYLILAIVIFIGVGLPLGIIKLFALDEFRMSEAAFGALVFPAAIAMAVFSVPMAKLGERLGLARSIHWGLAMCAAGLWVIAGGAFSAHFRTPTLLAAGAIPVGVGFLLAVPAWMASVADLDPARRGTHLGAVMTAQGIGAIIGTPIGGFVYRNLQPLGESLHFGASFGRYMPFVGCAFFITAGWLLSVKILRDRSGHNHGGCPPPTEPA